MISVESVSNQNRKAVVYGYQKNKESLRRLIQRVLLWNIVANFLMKIFSSRLVENELRMKLMNWNNVDSNLFVLEYNFLRI